MLVQDTGPVGTHQKFPDSCTLLTLFTWKVAWCPDVFAVHVTPVPLGVTVSLQPPEHCAAERASGTVATRQNPMNAARMKETVVRRNTSNPGRDCTSSRHASCRNRKTLSPAI